MRPSVSVIIPVYNTALYVAEAVNSVLDQSLAEVEVIVVDDGSTDGSLEILQGFSGRIKLVSQPNSGQGAARNRALSMARGEFVYFMDSDDWIDRDTLKICVERCRRDDLDFVFFDAVTFGSGFDAEANPWFDYHRGGIYTEVADGCSVMTDMLSRGIYRCSVCMCLYRTDFLRNNNIAFPEGILHEDEYFSAAACLRASRVAGIPQEFYHRRMRETSVMTTDFSPRNAEGYFTTIELCRGLGTGTREREALRLLTRGFAVTMMYNCRNLPLGYRLRTAWMIVTRHPDAFRLKPFLSLLFKKYFR